MANIPEMIIAYIFFTFFFFPTLGASLFEKIHCGHSDGLLGFFWEHEARRRKAEGAEEGEEAPRPGWTPGNNHFLSSPLSLCLICLSPPLSILSEVQNCARASIFMSDKEMESRCYVHHGCPQDNSDELNLWPLSVIGEQNCKSMRSLKLSPVRAFLQIAARVMPNPKPPSVYRMYV